MNKARSKILILVPAFTARGGITNYYEVLKEDLPSSVEYFQRGARTWPIRKGFFPELLRAYKDYNQFKKRLRKKDIALVQSTTSLGLSTTIRDGLFLRHARKNGIKTIAFFRGWDDNAEGKTQNKHFRLFKYLFFQSDALIVLSERVKATLIKWGYQGEIFRETTLVDKWLIDSVSEEQIIKKFDNTYRNKTINLLFLSRVEKRKGIYELIEAFEKLKSNKEFKFKLTICGEGFELEPIKQLIETKELKDIQITGFIKGEQKKAMFNQADVFVFPSHGEGMPNAVLEAMGFGLPVITTPVGGLVDFFENGVNGYLAEIKSSNDLAEKILSLVSNGDLHKKTALNNYKIAREQFSSEKVAERMMKIFAKTIKD